MTNHNLLRLILMLILIGGTIGTGLSHAVESAADTVLINGEFYTVDEEKSWAEVVAIKDGTIVHVGSMEGSDAFIDSQTEVIDLKGKFAMPSFVDAHMHPLSNAYAYKFTAALFDFNTHKQYIAAIEEFAQNNPGTEGFMGAGFDRYIYDDIGPRKEWLDAIDSTRPIAIVDKDIHTMWVNSKVFELLGWDKNTPDPEGGTIVRDPNTGELTGLLVEMAAMEPAWYLFPAPTKTEYKTSLLWLQEWLNREGITTAHDAWMEFDRNYYKAYDELAKAGQLTVRFRGSWYIDDAGNYLKDITKGLRKSKKLTHPHFKVNSFKFLADGAGDTAYEFGNNPNGLKIWQDDAMVSAFDKVDDAGFQIHVHTIGDRAVDYVVDALEDVVWMNGERDSRHSLAHVEKARSKDITRMGTLGLAAHITPLFLAKNPQGNESPYKSLFDAGVNVTNASDWTTSQFDPILNISQGLSKSNVSLEQMIKAGTFNGAHANFLENEIGSLEVGKKADIVVLSENIFNLNAREIANVSVERTFFEGRQVYSNVTPPPTSTIRVLAEWEHQEAVWLQWPGRWENVYESSFAKMTNVIVQYEKLHILYNNKRIKRQARTAIRNAGGDPDHYNIIWHRIANNNAWMRDNGPMYVVQDGEMRIQNWEFDAWGGGFGNKIRYKKDNRVPIAVGAYLNMPVDKVDIVHERGNLEFNGVDSVILNWSTIGDPNRNPGYTKNQAIADMKTYFGVSRVVLIEGVTEGDLTKGHIDGIARFIDVDTVVVPQCTQASKCKPGDGKDDKVYNDAATAISDAGFKVIREPLEGIASYNDSTFDTDYLNWIVGNGFVIVVGFDNPVTDAAAKARIESYYPGRDVHVIEMLGSWEAGGGAHCHTNDQPAL